MKDAKKMLVPRFALIFSIFVVTVKSAGQNAAPSFKREDIFKDLELNPLQHLPELKVMYGNKFVKCGNTLCVEETQDIPFVNLDEHLESDKTYTLLMADPDATSRENPIYRSYVHWIVTDLTKSNQDISNGLVSYFGPAPPKKSGPHRYIFLLFEQKGEVDFMGFSNENRINFGVGTFFKQNGISIVAGNYYFAENK